MCGIVSFFGQADGVTRVLEALHLLEYRAPDSAGLAAIDEAGNLAVRRSVGPPRKLVAAMAETSLYTSPQADQQSIADLVRRQDLDLEPDALRDCSPAAGYTLHDLYRPSGLRIGIGDRGACDTSQPADSRCRFSTRMHQALSASDAFVSPDYAQDAVHHAFRLVATHVASRIEFDEELRGKLDAALLARVPAGSYPSWPAAWRAEVAANTPGQAFAVAVCHFQQTFPGLAEHLDEGDWERVGGLTAQAMAQVVVGHGRWGMVGAVTQPNAHPLVDRSRTRAVVENGSHNPPLMLGIWNEQERWWHTHGVPEDEPVHRSENTTEAVVYEWERAFHQLCAGELPAGEKQILASFREWGIDDQEEQALRIALKRMTAGNAHACNFYSQRTPGALFVSSHHKPIAIAMRQRDLMIASDVNAALMLWSGHEVDVAAERTQALRETVAGGGPAAEQAQREIDNLLERFTVDVVFLDADLFQGEELLARISNKIEAGQVVPDVRVTRYDGTPVAVTSQRVRLNPAMVGRRGYDSYTESHIAEIPGVLDDLTSAYVADGQVTLDSLWQDDTLIAPGLNVRHLHECFGADLARLSRLLLIGEGSSWRDAQAAAPLFRELLPGVVVNVYRPVEVLNLGTSVDAGSDLAVEISWSGTTDSLLKVDTLLAEAEVVRVTVTGRPQSDLGRRTAHSGGTLNVRTGVEVSVATVKGFEAILATLDLLAVQLGRTQASIDAATFTRLTDDLTLVVPQHVRTVIEDDARRARMRRVAERCQGFNKVAVVGGSPIDQEGELKIEELAQIVAQDFDFHTSSLRSLIERSALMTDDRHRTLFIINATTPALHRPARAIINYLTALGVFCIIHTTPHAEVDGWAAHPSTEVFVSPQVADRLQPLIDAPFFFDLAVAMAYARGLSPEEVDRPRNLAKSVTTTGAERRSDVEARHEFHNVSLAEFAIARTAARELPTRATLRATPALRAVMAHLPEPPPALLDIGNGQHLIVVTDSEATENAAHMAAAAWQDLLAMDLAVYRRFISAPPATQADTALVRIVRAGAVLSVHDTNTIALPDDLSPLQLELLASAYLTSLAVRVARQRGADTGAWEAGLAQLPPIVAGVLGDSGLAQRVRRVLSPYVQAGYDKVQIIGGGQDYAAAASIARSLRTHGFMAEALYTDSAWHGPLATVGGPDAGHDTLIVILATDPLFQAAALVDTQVYRARKAPVVLVVPAGNEDLPAVRGVDASAVVEVPAVPRPFSPVVNVALGAVLAREMDKLWEEAQH